MRTEVIPHPVYCIPSENRAAFVRWGAIASLLVGVALFAVIESGPGIVPLALLVFAGSTGRADAVLETWTASDRILIAFANGFDYLFGLLLFGTLAIGCAWVGPRMRSPLSRAARYLVWLATLAVVLDIPENAAYLVMVHGDTGAPWPQLALAASVPRFVIIFLCVAFLISGFSCLRY